MRNVYFSANIYGIIGTIKTTSNTNTIIKKRNPKCWISVAWFNHPFIRDAPKAMCWTCRTGVNGNGIEIKLRMWNISRKQRQYKKMHWTTIQRWFFFTATDGSFQSNPPPTSKKIEGEEEIGPIHMTHSSQHNHHTSKHKCTRNSADSSNWMK